MAAGSHGMMVECRLLLLVVLHRDPQFLDMRAALTGFLWATGQKAAAEEAWEQLQAASDGLGAALYGKNKVLERVRHRQGTPSSILPSLSQHLLGRSWALCLACYRCV